MRALLDSTNVIAGVLEFLEDDYRYVIANRTAAAFYGLGDGELDGMTCRDLGFAEEVIAARMEALRACHAADGPTTVEYASRTADGRDGWYVGSYLKVPGAPPRLSFVVIDITAQRMAQQMAEAQTARLALALEATDLGIWEYDVKADRVDWDERTRSLFGVAADTQIDFASYAARIHPEDVPTVRRAYELGLSGADGGRYSVEHRTWNRDGRQVWVRGAARVIFDGKGAAVRILGTAQDITDQVAARERQALLVAELKHRVKNNLATVQAIASHTRRASNDDMEAFDAAFQNRLMSLARGHELLTRTSWGTPDLTEVLQAALEPFNAEAFRIDGAKARVRLHPELAINLVMVLHELATNATKYGALSQDGGRVAVAWSVADGALALDWREQDGPPVRPPQRDGFGTRLKDAALRQFDGVVHSEFAPDGLRCRIVAPLSDSIVVEDAAPGGESRLN